jgi:hypothetical protein
MTSIDLRERSKDRQRRCIWPIVLIAASCFFLTSCASIARGHTQRVSVSSEPEGALIYQGKELIGITPASVILDRKNLVLRFEKEGYSPREVGVKRALSGWLVADVAAGVGPALGVLSTGEGSPSKEAAAVAIVGGTDAGAMIAVDFLTGSVWTLPSAVHVMLKSVERR